MIDIRQEQVVRLSDVPKLNLLPRRSDGKRHHVATIYRWAQRGLDGVRLETLKVGGTTCTSVEALQRFFERLTDATVCPATAPATPTPRTRQRQIERAAREAEALLAPGGAR